MTRQFHRPVLMEPAEAERYTGAEDTAATSALAHQSARRRVQSCLLQQLH